MAENVESNEDAVRNNEREKARAIINDLQRLDAKAKSMEDALSDGRRTKLRALVGEHYDKMLSSRQYTEKCLTDPDPKLRYVALQSAIYHWGEEEKYGQVVERLAQADPDAEVRLSAIGFLGHLFRSSHDRNKGQVLARIILNESESVPVRMEAYRSLLEVMDNFPSFKAKFSKIDISKDVNWEFVRSFYDF